MFIAYAGSDGNTVTTSPRIAGWEFRTDVSERYHNPETGWAGLEGRQYCDGQPELVTHEGGWRLQGLCHVGKWWKH